MAHPNSLKNLRPPWRPGQVPNPKGVNKKRPFSDRYEQMGEARAPIELIQKINKDFGKPILSESCSWVMLLTARAYLQVYLRGDTNMLRKIADRVEGRSPNRLDLQVAGRTEVTFVVKQDDPLPYHDRVEELLFRYIVQLIEQSNDEADENFLTKAAELAQLIKARAKQKGRTIDVPQIA